MSESEIEVDSAFWRTAYENHGAAILGYLSTRLRRRHEAEDLLQETFVRAIRAGDALRDTARVRSYLFSIAHRLLLNQGRKKRPFAFAEVTEDQTAFTGRIEDTVNPNPEEDAQVGSLRRRIEGVLAACPEDHRRAFRAAVFEHRSYAEIADREGWAMNRVRINVYRARQRIIAELGDTIRESSI